MRKMALIAAGVVAAGVLLASAFLFWASLAGFRPASRQELRSFGSARAPLPAELSLLTWNLGYAGLGAEADFFYDGGRMSRALSRAGVKFHLHNLLSFLRAQGPDLCLLQEADRRSRRSWEIDEMAALRSGLPDRMAFFALNYRVRFIPLPLTRPMGGVESGLLTLSRFGAGRGERISLPGRFSWPTRLFMPNRCLLVVRLPLPGGRGELSVVNLHNSTFDPGGKVRRRELAFLREFLLAERAGGRLVVAGGDWNHRLPGTDDRRFPAADPTPDWVAEMPADWAPPGWSWAVDPAVPTVRASSAPYREGRTYRSVIDGFLVSPGLEILSVRGVDLGFADSDHNPVRLRLRLGAAPGLSRPGQTAPQVDP